MAEKQIQEYLFQRIKEILPASKTLVDSIAELLHVSQDSAYRRIRGETPLVLEEARQLCQYYHLSLDQLLTIQQQSVVFDNIELNTTGSDFTSYLSGILHELKKLASYNQKKIIYSTNDVPFFYQFCCPSISAFRYFFWMKTIIQHPSFVRQKFSLNCLPAETEAIGKEVLSVYCQIPSIEIWNAECIHGTLIQISYYLEAGIITKEDAIEIYKGLRDTLEHLQEQAAYGRKFIPGENPLTKKDNFQLFHNRVGLGDNIILTIQDEKQKTYLNYDSLSYMATVDESFCNMVQRQLQTTINRSTQISSVSEKQRNIFFNILYAKIPTYQHKNVKPVV
jgi:hypothetical protein